MSWLRVFGHLTRAQKSSEGMLFFDVFQPGSKSLAHILGIIIKRVQINDCRVGMVRNSVTEKKPGKIEFVTLKYPRPVILSDDPALPNSNTALTMSLDIDNTDFSLPAILSRIPTQSPPLPTELILTLLTPLLTPHKESRDHHLLITSSSPSPTATLIRNVPFPSSVSSANDS